MAQVSDNLKIYPAQSYDLFFYGTLIHPAILARVIGNDGAHLTLQEALLPGHTRHHVCGEDYPAVVPISSSSQLLKRTPAPTEATVRGTLVSGLTGADVAFLDTFEGDDYTRVVAGVIPTSGPSQTPRNSTSLRAVSDPDSVASILPPLSDEQIGQFLLEPTRPAHVYLWAASIERLAPSIWSFEDFVRDKAQNWVGQTGDGSGKAHEYAEVDRRRAMGGKITPRTPNGGSGSSTPSEFGHSMRKYFAFDDKHTNLNCGSFGVCPHRVREVYREWQDKIEAQPDHFMMMVVGGEVNKVRARLAPMLGADVDEVVLVANSTTGVNAVVRDLDWKKGDVILLFSTIYNACGSTLRYVSDSHPAHPELLILNVEYPLSHDALVSQVRNAIESFETEEAKKGKRIRAALVDAISSHPGVIVPWERLVKLFREHAILSIVDGAHAIGQIEVDLHAADPDFFVTNVHKWAFAHRGCAVLYVPKRNLHLARSSLPTPRTYQGPPEDGKPSTWVDQWAWTGTITHCSYLSIEAALDFRQSIGGEAQIREYNHDLAVKGGKLVAQKLGTEVMETEKGELTAAMVNVRLPIELKPGQGFEYEDWFIRTLDREYNTIVPLFKHAGKLWTRLSAQIWLDLSDFEFIARALGNLCKRVNDGQVSL